MARIRTFKPEFLRHEELQALEVKLSDRRKITVRIADHSASKSNLGRFQFDIHTIERRYGSLDYIEFIDVFKQIVGKRRNHEKKREWRALLAARVAANR